MDGDGGVADGMMTGSLQTPRWDAERTERREKRTSGVMSRIMKISGDSGSLRKRV